jgi:formylglycine-generating enzyme required for sulfatase activity
MISMPPGDNPIRDFLLNIAANLASDILKAGATRLDAAIVGTPEEHAYHRAFTHAFLRVLEQLPLGTDESTADPLLYALREFAKDEQIAEILLDVALRGREPPVRLLRNRFASLGFDAATLQLDFETAMRALVRGLAEGLRSEAQEPNSPLFNRVSQELLLILSQENREAWKEALPILRELRRLQDPRVWEVTPETRRQFELKHLQAVQKKYNMWRDLYTEPAARVFREDPVVRFKVPALRYLEMQHHLYKEITHEPDDDLRKVVMIKNFAELMEGIRKFGRVALIGEPGAGKTTTLERLAYELATEAAENESAPLPLFAMLGEYGGGEFDLFLETTFGGLWLRDYLPGRVFLLLDGLNETPPEVIPAVQDWIVNHPEVKLIVTCRRLDYINLRLPLQRIDVSPLDVNRIHLFIGNYLEDEDRERLFWELSGAATRASREWLQREKKDATFNSFWFDDGELPGHDWMPERRDLNFVRKALREEGKLPGMLGVVSNPFLLFLTVFIFREDRKPPVNRGQLFDRFVHQLFEKRGRTAAKTRSPWISEDVQRRMLAALAYRMQAERSGSSVDAGWACQVIEEHLADFPLPLGEGTDMHANADQIVYLAASAGIIEHGKVLRFVHQLLQEYFATAEIREDIRRGVPATKYFPLGRWWEPTGWEEALLLLAGTENNATKIVEWLTPVQPTLAYRCATETGVTCAADVLQTLFDPPIPSLPVYEKGAEIDEWREKLPRITPLARAEWGRQLAARGDTRKGVGVGPDGLPDIDWVEIPAGKFQYGGDPQAYQSAQAQEVYLPTYYIARYPITYTQFQVFVDSEDGIRNDRWWNGLAEQFKEPPEPYFKYANHPRDMINWYQAVAFCRWLSHRLWSAGTPLMAPANEQRSESIPLLQAEESMNPFAWTVRLPTEHEWEKAARGTDGRKYPWGNDYISGYANIDETFNDVGSYYVRQTTAVGMYPQGASPYGVMDMSGNVWEWCLTEYHSGKNDDLSNANLRVRRGGSWINVNDFARATYRYSRNPRPTYFDYGFRIVCASAFWMSNRSIVPKTHDS